MPNAQRKGVLSSGSALAFVVVVLVAGSPAPIPSVAYGVTDDLAEDSH
jgi:hypothetical protein